MVEEKKAAKKMTEGKNGRRKNKSMERMTKE